MNANANTNTNNTRIRRPNCVTRQKHMTEEEILEYQAKMIKYTKEKEEEEKKRQQEKREEEPDIGSEPMDIVDKSSQQFEGILPTLEK